MKRIGDPELNTQAMYAGRRAPASLASSLALTTGCIFLLATASVLAATAAESPVAPERRPLKSVFDVQRPPSNDLVVLTTGEQLSGTVLNESFKLQTVYAEIELKRRVVAGLDLASAPGGFAVLLTVNNNHLAGLLKDPVITLKSVVGDQQQIRREKIAHIIFRVRDNEVSGIPEGTWIYLKNGDRISGQLMIETLPLRTSNGTNNASLSELRFLSNTNTPELALLVLRTGQSLRGTLALEDLPFHLDLGQKVSLFAEHVAVIDTARNVQRGSEGDVSTTDSSPPRPLPVGPRNIEGMVWIPAGEFVMGSPKEEVGRDADEGPATKVTFARGFWLDKHEVTQAEYQRIMGSNPSTSAADPHRPVEKVSWFEAVEYCRKLNQMAEKAETLPAGYVYRLPTEAEWEYACRAGTTTRFSYGDDNSGSELTGYAWFTRNSDSTTHAVEIKRPNGWGLHDMHGNVWEWCLDRWEDGLPGGSITNSAVAAKGTLRVARGGSWLYDPKACRSANRDDYSPWDKCSDIGFRVALAPLDSEDGKEGR